MILSPNYFVSGEFTPIHECQYASLSSTIKLHKVTGKVSHCQKKKKKVPKELTSWNLFNYGITSNI